MQKIGVKSGYMQKLHSIYTQFFKSASVQVLKIKNSTYVIKTIIETTTILFKSLSSFRQLALLVKALSMI